MIFARNESEIIERESYLVIKTVSNPNYHWGNFLIFKSPPKDGDLINWMNIFQKELSFYKNFDHYVFAWDEPIPPTSVEYLNHNFELQESITLQTSELVKPKHYNEKVIIRPLQSAKEWEDADEIQIATRDQKYSYAEYKEFKINQSKSYQKLVDLARGERFGAFLNNVLVADLGIYYEGDLARYQNVATHPDYQRQGICATLVYESGLYAFKNWNVLNLAMEADPDYHAAKIYESVGFKPMENSYALYWYNSQK